MKKTWNAPSDTWMDNYYKLEEQCQDLHIDKQWLEQEVDIYRKYLLRNGYGIQILDIDKEIEQSRR